MMTTPYSGFCWYAQGFDAGFARKHTHDIRLDHEHVSLIHVKRAECREMDADCLQEATCAHVV